MVRLGNLNSINQHREAEEEDNEAGAPPGSRHGANQGQGAADEEVGVESSRTGLGNGNVLGITLGGSTIPVRGVNFSPGRSYATGEGEGRQ